MLSFIIWLLLLVVLIIKGYYKTAASIVLLPFVLLYGLIFVLASRSSFDNGTPTSNIESPPLPSFANLNEVTANPIPF